VSAGVANPRRVILIGATGSIARAIAARLAERGDRLLLCARDPDELERDAADLRHRFGAEVHTIPLDVLDSDAIDAFAQRATQTLGTIDGVIFAQGFMCEQEQAEQDHALAQRMIDVNYTACVRLSFALLPELTREGRDRQAFIAYISSVAGDRGRASNFAYGSTKAALDTFAEGLRQKWRGRVGVTCVKPGFTDTAMTWGLPGMFLVASPDRVARDTLRAIDRDRGRAYTPWFWRWIMLIIRSVPRLVYDRVKL